VLFDTTSIGLKNRKPGKKSSFSLISMPRAIAGMKKVVKYYQFNYIFVVNDLL